LNPNKKYLNDLLEGLKTNDERYGYPSCPCRMSTGNFEFDRDIICPCDYRDPDIQEYGVCYCSLYVNSKTQQSGETKSIPERRPMEKQIRAYGLGFELPKGEESKESVSHGRKLMFCKVCGYVTYRDDPPYICPICRAKKEMFAELKHEVVMAE
jgi:ferredoxin-thioredoxin reductase catalytic subunit